ncbi:MAG: hypothetical protein IPH04_10920 [Saprospirales bacterium]|nr:hypothetical protein [Saprospirales bacterium]MBK6903294.1 hypothetical protein [Saprospirales bacterium]
MKFQKAFILLLLPVALMSFAIAQDWKFIADKWVSFRTDHDEIYLGDFRDDFRQLKLRVTDGPLKMYDMKIHFDNGSVQDVQLRTHFKAGQESRVIDLDGGLRHLTKISFWYETKGVRKGKARVAVWGTK